MPDCCQGSTINVGIFSYTQHVDQVIDDPPDECIRYQLEESGAANSLKLLQRFRKEVERGVDETTDWIHENEEKLYEGDENYQFLKYYEGGPFAVARRGERVNDEEE